ncbi:hypothetical protein [Pleomorphomonas koreensis]|uniref:hypothetical protein n=1 Tax=Pleomorphomonas koreensis TaxID=257440 RepID=UPI0004181BB8|nr:hypothetical protein [Pleomorphomonas koreensis]
MSGLHDLDRRLVLINHFPVPASVCLNKWDIAAEKSAAEAVVASAGDIRAVRQKPAGTTGL